MSLTQTEKMVVHNSAQDDSIERVLVVCSVGALRSPTITRVIHEQHIDWNTRSAGLDPLALVPVTEKLIEWADVCICVEQAHADIIANDWGFEGMIYNFSIPDVYEYADPKLVEIIKERLETRQIQWVY